MYVLEPLIPADLHRRSSHNGQDSERELSLALAQFKAETATLY